MAQVTPHWMTLSGIDRDIAIAIGNWEDVSAVAMEWDTWSANERFVYFIDWPVVEERTMRLLALEPTMLTNDERKEQLRTLRALVARNRPILEGLLTRIP